MGHTLQLPIRLDDRAHDIDKDDGLLKRENVSAPNLERATTRLETYLKLYPSGQYAQSARGLMRRIAWLGGDFPYVFDRADGRLSMQTPAGDFSVQVLDERGHARDGDVVAGQERPPRGWLSRYYGEKIAVPSLAVAAECALPATFEVVYGHAWKVPPKRLPDGRQVIGFHPKAAP